MTDGSNILSWDIESVLPKRKDILIEESRNEKTEESILDIIWYDSSDDNRVSLLGWALIIDGIVVDASSPVDGGFIPSSDLGNYSIVGHAISKEEFKKFYTYKAAEMNNKLSWDVPQKITRPRESGWFTFRGVNAKVSISRVENKEPGEYCYGIRHSDSSWTRPSTVELSVAVNYWATLITDAPLQGLTDHNDYLEITSKERKYFIQSWQQDYDGGEEATSSLKFSAIQYHPERQERMHPEIEDKINRGQSLHHGNSALPEGYVETNASNTFNSNVEQIRNNTGIPADRAYKNVKQIRHQIQALEQPHAQQLEQLAISIVEEQMGMESGEVNWDIKLGTREDIDPEEFSFENQQQPPEIPSTDIGGVQLRHFDEEDIKKEVDKRRILNSMTQGAAQKAKNMFYFAQQQLNQISPDLVNLYKRFIPLTQFRYWVKGDPQDMPQIGGATSVSLDEEEGEEKKPTIHATATTFVVLLAEMVKGVMELLSLHGLPQDQEMIPHVYKQTEDLKNERWDIRLGQDYWDKLLAVMDIADPRARAKLYENLVKLPAETFNGLIKGVLSGSPEAKQKMQELSGDLSTESSDIRKIPPMDSRYYLSLADRYPDSDIYCSVCNRVLHQDVYFDAHNEPYCKRCYDKYAIFRRKPLEGSVKRSYNEEWISKKKDPYGLSDGRYIGDYWWSTLQELDHTTKPGDRIILKEYELLYDFANATGELKSYRVPRGRMGTIIKVYKDILKVIWDDFPKPSEVMTLPKGIEDAWNVKKSKVRKIKKEHMLNRDKLSKPTNENLSEPPYYKEVEKNLKTIYYDENDRIHRLDGPAVEWADGRKSWYLHGDFVTEDVFNKRKRFISDENNDINNLNNEANMNTNQQIVAQLLGEEGYNKAEEEEKVKKSPDSGYDVKCHGKTYHHSTKEDAQKQERAIWVNKNKKSSDINPYNEEDDKGYENEESNQIGTTNKVLKYKGWLCHGKKNSYNNSKIDTYAIILGTSIEHVNGVMVLMIVGTNYEDLIADYKQMKLTPDYQPIDSYIGRMSFQGAKELEPIKFLGVIPMENFKNLLGNSDTVTGSKRQLLAANQFIPKSKVAADISDQVPPMGWENDESNADTPAGAGSPLPPNQNLQNEQPTQGQKPSDANVLYDSNQDSGPQFQTTVNPKDKSVTVKFMGSPEEEALQQAITAPPNQQKPATPPLAPPAAPTAPQPTGEFSEQEVPTTF